MKNIQKNLKFMIIAIGLLSALCTQGSFGRKIAQQTNALTTRTKLAATTAAATVATIAASGAIPAITATATTAAGTALNALSMVDPMLAAGLLVGRGTMGLTTYMINRALVEKPTDAGLVLYKQSTTKDPLTKIATAMASPEIAINTMHNRIDTATDTLQTDWKKAAQACAVGFTAGCNAAAMGAYHGAAFVAGVDAGIISVGAYGISRCLQSVHHNYQNIKKSNQAINEKITHLKEQIKQKDHEMKQIQAQRKSIETQDSIDNSQTKPKP